MLNFLNFGLRVILFNFPYQALDVTHLSSSGFNFTKILLIRIGKRHRMAVDREQRAGSSGK
ncbi:MAG TPA: hypothetical protein DCW86_03220 [Actinobacteria bacterium]|nr:hypothetical protein [Actinomycetota bacterium]